MKVDRSLKEVWEWKEKNYRDMRHMSIGQKTIFLRKRADEFKRKHNLQLKSAPQTESAFQ